MNHYINVLKKYAVFNGRSGRAEFWYFLLFTFLFSFALGVFERVMGFGEMISDIYSLVTFLPLLGVYIRRMHDVNKSGWFILIPIYNIILAASPSVNENNKYSETAK